MNSEFLLPGEQRNILELNGILRKVQVVNWTVMIHNVKNKSDKNAHFAFEASGDVGFSE